MHKSREFHAQSYDIMTNYARGFPGEIGGDKGNQECGKIVKILIENDNLCNLLLKFLLF